MPRPRTFRPSDQAWIEFQKWKDLHKFKTDTQAMDHILLHLNQPQPITSDVPLGEPQNPEKQKAIEKLKEEAVRELPLPPCHYCGKGYIDAKRNVQIVFCRNPKRIPKGKTYDEVPFSICYSCWEGIEWSKKQRERKAEEKPIAESIEEPIEQSCLQCLNILKKPEYPQGIYIRQETDKLKDFPIGSKLIYCIDDIQGGLWKTLENCQNCYNKKTTIPKEPSSFILHLRELAKKRGFTGFSHYKCFRGNDNLKGETNFVYKDIRELMDKLPCLKDPTTDCIFTECRQILMTKIKAEAPELIEILAKKTTDTYQQST